MIQIASPPASAGLLGGGTVREAGRRQLEGLDGIRGIAILLVMAVHFDRFVPAVSVLVPLKALADYGWCGVDLFFVLSGFLITGILLQTKTAHNYFRAFYMRRVLRILRRNGFEGVLIPDHTPQMTCAAPWHAGMAYAMGFMRAALKELASSPAS